MPVREIAREADEVGVEPVRNIHDLLRMPTPATTIGMDVGDMDNPIAVEGRRHTVGFDDILADKRRRNGIEHPDRQPQEE